MGYEVDSTPGDEGVYWSDDQCSYCNADLVRRDEDEHYGLEFRTCVKCAERFCPECEADLEGNDPHDSTCKGQTVASEIVPERETTPSEIERRRAKQALVASGTW
jgi:hypothetical protein